MTRSASGPRHPVEALSFGACHPTRIGSQCGCFQNHARPAPERTRPGLGIIEPCLPSPSKGWVKYEGNIMRRTVCAFAVATLICAARYETSHAAPIATPTGMQTGRGDITLVYAHRRRIVIPLTRRYEYRPYWWPQGQYHWSPFGVERWGYWCEGAGAHRLSC